MFLKLMQIYELNTLFHASRLKVLDLTVGPMMYLIFLTNAGVFYQIHFHESQSCAICLF